MSGIGGVKKESSNNESFSKKVGLFEANVIAVNPTIEEYKSKLGIELKEDSKAVEYTGTSKDGNNTLRIVNLFFSYNIVLMYLQQVVSYLVF